MVDVARARKANLTPLAQKGHAERLTYLAPGALARVEACAQDVTARGVPGAFLETGVALGGTAIVLAAHARDARRSFHGYDVFEMMPAPGERDPEKAHERYALMTSGAAEGIGGDPFVFYLDDLYGTVVASFERHGVPLEDRVMLHRGLIEETLQLDEPVAVAHIDTDWYEPVRLSVTRIWPHLSVGGYLVCDDYGNYDGVVAAMDEFRAAHADELETVWEKGHLSLRRR